jgi:hypothetical protein
VARTYSFTITSKAVPTELADSPDEENPTGGISPLRVNHTMALRMLDQEHKLLGQDSADHKVYVLAG